MSNGKKSSSTNTQSERPSAKEQRSTGSNRADEVISREQEQGFRGVEVDPTPNEAYTVEGVTSGAPTPETDVDTAKEARDVTGLGLSALEYQTKDNEALEAGRARSKEAKKR